AALCVASLHLLLFVCVFLLFFCFPSALSSSLFPYTTLFRSFFLRTIMIDSYQKCVHLGNILSVGTARKCRAVPLEIGILLDFVRSEEHTSELQSRFDIVCRLLLEKKKKNEINIGNGTNVTRC